MILVRWRGSRPGWWNESTTNRRVLITTKHSLSSGQNCHCESGLILSSVARYNWHVHYLDVCHAFFQSDLHNEVYMQLPQELASHGKSSIKVCRLVESLYGLKQASRQWNLKLSKAYVRFNQNCLDHSFFKRDIIITSVYVDYMLVSASNIIFVIE